MSVAIAEAKETVRVCKVCGVEKQIGEFYTSQYHIHMCKQCTSEQSKKHYQFNRGIVIARTKQYQEQNKEAIRERKHKYYIEHREAIIASVMKYHYEHWNEYYRTHGNIRKARSQDYYHNSSKPRNLELYGTVCTPLQLQEAREQAAEVRAKNKVLYGYTYPLEEREKRQHHFTELRTKALEYYGGKCECCGESRYAMLTFDHKIKTYYKNKARGVALVYAVIKEYAASGYPNDKYRVLCWNCNTSRGYYGYCPHESNHNGEHNYPGKASKLEMIDAYGGKCVLCGEAHWEFLTIDHINGGGNKHRAKIGGGMNFYNMLKKQGYPKDEYRLLCANCNCSNRAN